MSARVIPVPDGSPGARLDDGRRVQDGIASVFDRAAGYYRDMRWEKNRVVRLEKEMTRRVISEELGEGPVSSALEIGCGPGTWTPLLAERAATVVALDLSEKMLERAREAVRQPHVTFAQGDAATYRPDRDFDLVMSIRVLEYVPEWRAVIGRLRQLVAPGGRAVVITKTPVSVWRGTGRERWFGPHTLGRRLTGRKLDPEFWQVYLPVRELRRAFAEAGLVDLRVRPVIFGLPIYVRGSKQYPIVPKFAEAPFLRATEATWRWVSRQSEGTRLGSLVLAESYAVSGRRPAP
ncbi:MAG TPA: methyltransferase domain-containing protein [Candidatus Binatia bacterium]|nr:methyltransferase domain-containing protein [Candidatus Binatia bacterium]